MSAPGEQQSHGLPAAGFPNGFGVPLYLMNPLALNPLSQPLAFPLAPFPGFASPLVAGAGLAGLPLMSAGPTAQQSLDAMQHQQKLADVQQPAAKREQGAEQQAEENSNNADDSHEPQVKNNAYQQGEDGDGKGAQGGDSDGADNSRAGNSSPADQPNRIARSSSKQDVRAHNHGKPDAGNNPAAHGSPQSGKTQLNLKHFPSAASLLSMHDAANMSHHSSLTAMSMLDASQLAAHSLSMLASTGQDMRMPPRLGSSNKLSDLVQNANALLAPSTSALEQTAVLNIAPLNTELDAPPVRTSPMKMRKNSSCNDLPAEFLQSQGSVPYKPLAKRTAQCASSTDLVSLGNKSGDRGRGPNKRLQTARSEVEDASVGGAQFPPRPLSRAGSESGGNLQQQYSTRSKGSSPYARMPGSAGGASGQNDGNHDFQPPSARAGRNSGAGADGREGKGNGMSRISSLAALVEVAAAAAEDEDQTEDMDDQQQADAAAATSMLMNSNRNNSTAQLTQHGAMSGLQPSTSMQPGFGSDDMTERRGGRRAGASAATAPTTTTTSLSMDEEMMMAGMDENELKRLKRKQSNRESARRSRLKKQAEADALSRATNDLQGKNAALTQALAATRNLVDRLMQDKAQLIEQVRKLGGEVSPELEMVKGHGMYP